MNTEWMVRRLFCRQSKAAVIRCVGNGVELKGEIGFTMEEHGYGAVLAVDEGQEPSDLEAYLKRRRELTREAVAHVFARVAFSAAADG